jgi:hypothetical protein
MYSSVATTYVRSLIVQALKTVNKRWFGRNLKVVFYETQKLIKSGLILLLVNRDEK